MNWNQLTRQIHRWLSIAFTLAVVITSVALAQKDPILWLSYLPLAPLALMFLTGVYLFALPYVGKWRATRQN
jgi:predicted Na+-dependent transporter